MYKLVETFMEWGCCLEDGHLLNIREWAEKFLNINDIEIDLQRCDGDFGYAYCGGYLITFSENPSGMLEYKVWKDYK